jgi:hypothetical protein
MQRVGARGEGALRGAIRAVRRDMCLGRVHPAKLAENGGAGQERARITDHGRKVMYVGERRPAPCGPADGVDIVGAVGRESFLRGEGRAARRIG